MTDWQEIKMSMRWGIACFLLARVVQLTEQEASPKLLAAYDVAIEEIERKCKND